MQPVAKFYRSINWVKVRKLTKKTKIKFQKIGDNFHSKRIIT